MGPRRGGGKEQVASRDQHRHVCVTSLALAVSVPAEVACFQTTKPLLVFRQGSASKKMAGRKPRSAWRFGSPCEVGSHRGTAPIQREDRDSP